ncbi:MAG: hypothetical protein IJQ21_06755 [Lachnospiraceae bacterium]|nr:hypothetical protein [Lachnospiraceae bacterium]
MTTGQELETLYQDYLAAAQRAEQARRPFDGIFGFGKKASDDPCHEDFYRQLEALLERFAESRPESGTVKGVLSRICEAPDGDGIPKSAYWVLIAAQGLTLKLVPFLSAEDAGAVLETCRKTACFRNPLPAQKEVLRALNRQGGGSSV